MASKTTTTKQEYLANLRQRILRGSFDKELDGISNAIRLRREAIRQEETAQALAELSPGDRVRIKGALRPKYLIGYEGTVVGTAYSKGREFIEIDLDVPYVRRYNGKGLRVPPNCLVKV